MKTKLHIFSSLTILFTTFLFQCNNSDDLFFVLNPNKKTVLDKEKRECRKNVSAYYLLAAPIVKVNFEQQCSDGKYIEKNKFSTKEQCLGKLDNDFTILISAMLASCPKGLTSLD